MFTGSKTYVNIDSKYRIHTINKPASDDKYFKPGTYVDTILVDTFLQKDKNKDWTETILAAILNTCSACST